MKQGTREALLSAGKKSFARHGYDGASVRDITRAARTNLGAITYHFGTKREFYHEVLSFAVEPLATATLAAIGQPGEPMQRVRTVVRAYFTALSADPDVARLILNELVLSNTPPDLESLPIRPLLARLVEVVKDGQSKGDFRDGDPGLLALSILSGPLHMHLLRRALKPVFGIDLDDEAMRERALQHVIAFACAGLARQETQR